MNAINYGWYKAVKLEPNLKVVVGLSICLS